MVIGSSAIIAILENEPEAERLAEAIANDPIRLMSAASLFADALAKVLHEPLLRSRVKVGR